MSALDTSIDVARRQRAIFASKSPAEKVTMVAEMSALVRELTLAGIVQRHPGISDDDKLIHLIERLHGRELADEVEASLVARRGG